MSWYGSYSSETKALDSLIDRRPSLADLLLCPDFLSNFKMFNPKLLDYMTNSPTLPIQIINYLAIAPLETDSMDRKFKLPLLTIQMIETQTTCILNSLLKNCKVDKINKEIPAIVAMFYMGLQTQEVLPLLAGYMQRALLVLYRTRFKEVTDCLYAHKEVFDLLIDKSSVTSIAATLSLCLNLQITKNPVSSQQRMLTKIVVIRKILQKMSIEWRRIQGHSSDSVIVYENLGSILRQIIEKYCLISDGKPMLQVILEQKHINLYFECIQKQSEFSYPAMEIILTLIKYYTFSALNSDEGSEDLARKNMARLESQYFLIKFCETFQVLMGLIRNTPKMTLYFYKLLEVLCHGITLSSLKIFNQIKEAQLYPILIQLIFKHENCNILHKLIERAFLHIFVTDKKIYDHYKKYLFCEISVIDLTVSKILSLYPDGELEKAMKKPYFGIFMKIVKIYSGIETTDDNIREAITSKSEIWNKMSKRFIRPYENIHKEKLGEIKKNDELHIIPIEYTVTKIQNSLHTTNIFSTSQVNLVTKAIKEIKEEEEKMPKTLSNSSDSKANETLSVDIDDMGKNIGEKSPGSKNQDDQQDGFFKVPSVVEQAKKTENKQQKLPQKKESEGEAHKNNSFTDFMTQKKAEAEKEIRLQRSMSGDKRLSAGKKSRMASPSPNRKRNSWKQDDSQSADNTTSNIPAKKDKKIFANKDIPKVPMPGSKQNLLSKSAVQAPTHGEKEDPNKQFSSSMANLQFLKRTKIVRIDVKPEEKKKYRKVEQKDKPLLMYLGIKL